ncbi:uncharacterized protein LOC116433149 [Nomia melanderi]|uniref:uncharacterized protein LOC116433149 n=1 Tax=Nomia melanderi TaxID=2448451 RepID=UPI003FCD21C6
MTVSTMWIKNNMLFYDQYERQLTEAEMKVRRSLEKLSIPDWYLNKRSSPPKILNNIPIGSREPFWKNADWKNSTLNLTTSTISVTDTMPREQQAAKDTPNKGTYKVSRQQKSPEKQKSPPKESKLEDTRLPEVKSKRNISKTFPKVSPSRKIQNINIVLVPRRPPINLSRDLEDTDDSPCKYSTFKVKKQERQPTNTMDNEQPECKSCDCHSTPQKPPRRIKNDSSWTTDANSVLKTPNAKGNFKVRAASTPKFLPVNLFASTIIEETPKAKKVPSQRILEKLSIFEDTLRSSASDRSFGSAGKPKKLSQSMSEKASVFESSWREEPSTSLKEAKARSFQNTFLERNIRSIDPIMFETDTPARSSFVREIVKRVEAPNACERNSEFRRARDDQRVNMNSMLGSQSVNKNPLNQASPLGREKGNAESPCTRFLNSRRKSIELENVVRSKQPARERNVVRSIIETLAEKVSKSSLPRRSEVARVNQNFVKTVVSTLEKGKKSRRNEEEVTSCSESEAKSCTTSVSPKDTDSSDTEQRSPRGSDDSNRTFDYDTLASSKVSERSRQDEDSVYWIPVSRCKLPRTSSLISMMSKLSGNGQSPSVSPIRSDNEIDNSRVHWGATFKKTNGLAKKLFRIDETTVVDSGYSDKSDRSVVGCSMTENTLSEDTQTESGSETTIVKVRRSLRRRSILGATFRIQC